MVHLLLLDSKHSLVTTQQCHATSFECQTSLDPSNRVSQRVLSGSITAQALGPLQPAGSAFQTSQAEVSIRVKYKCCKNLAKNFRMLNTWPQEFCNIFIVHVTTALAFLVISSPTAGRRSIRAFETSRHVYKIGWMQTWVTCRTTYPCLGSSAMSEGE